MVDAKQFIDLTGIVIDNFEGGYYHPNMLSRFKPSDQKLLKFSGETMFGIDRKAGIQLAKYPEWDKMWKLIDEDRRNNPSLWKYQYRGGNLSSELKKLVSQMMFKWFTYLAEKYISATSMEVISNDSRLIIHFSYACWNGEGWFKRFATALNKAILKYPESKQDIFNETIKARTMATNLVGIPNSVIRQQGKKMIDLFSRLHI